MSLGEGTGMDPADTPQRQEQVAALSMMVDAMTGAVAVARALVLIGRRIDLDGIDREVGDLCAEAVGLPREDARPLLPPLETLCGEVTALIDELRRRDPVADA